MPYKGLQFIYSLQVRSGYWLQLLLYIKIRSAIPFSPRCRWSFSVPQGDVTCVREVNFVESVFVLVVRKVKPAIINVVASRDSRAAFSCVVRID